MVIENESEYSEMDLLLGIADLHTPEAVTATESSIVGFLPVAPLAACCGKTESIALIMMIVIMMMMRTMMIKMMTRIIINHAFL